MTSIFERALGADFERLHPQLQRRFGVGLDSGYACVGTGTMDRIRHGSPLLRPFLALGAIRNILVPRGGRGIPFRIENYPYRDSLGRETVTFVRSFTFPDRGHRFDATMVFDPSRRVIVDYLGTHQHLAADLHPSVDADGALLIRSGRQLLVEGPVAVRVPGFLTGAARLRESFDEATGRFRIQVRVTNPLLGTLFAYEGGFTAEYVRLAERPVPARVKPRREQPRGLDPKG